MRLFRGARLFANRYHFVRRRRTGEAIAKVARL
jgi:hypothetical protein